jgi:5'-nucleotidase
VNDEAPNPQQLVLPLPGVASLAPPAGGIPRSDRVFVNRNLRLSTIEWIGFDMDYTLAVYNQQQMDTLSIELTAEQMIKRGYPAYLKQLEYDARFPIRGLLIDKRFGHILKMDRHKVVLKGYHGLQRLSREKLTELYHYRRIRPHTGRYHWIDTLFALSEVTSYAAIVDALEKRGEHVDYDRVFTDVRASIDEAHRDGSVYSVVTNDLPRFVTRDPELARTLHKFRSAGKKLFLLTNSPWAYTNLMMTYLLGSAMPEYPSWQHFFDVVIVSAQKPLWFQEGHPLSERDGETLRPARPPLERFRVYQGGNLREVERLLQLRGSSVLYVGDHIYGDILRSKKSLGWRTMLVVPELEAELDILSRSGGAAAELRTLRGARDALEDQIQRLVWAVAHGEGAAGTGGRGSGCDGGGGGERGGSPSPPGTPPPPPPLPGDEDYPALIANLKAQRDAVRAKHRALLRAHHERFHAVWGRLLKTGYQNSRFAHQVERFACLYTSHVANLHFVSPDKSFRATPDHMAHEYDPLLSDASLPDGSDGGWGDDGTGVV